MNKVILACKSKRFEDVQQHFGGNGNGPFLLCRDLNGSGHRGLEITRADGCFSRLDVKKEIVQDGQGVAAIEHATDGLELSEQSGTGDDELHAMYMGPRKYLDALPLASAKALHFFTTDAP